MKYMAAAAEGMKSDDLSVLFPNCRSLAGGDDYEIAE
jgi:hypothetical protein